MTALSSNSSEWQTPPWLVDKIRAVLGGTIHLDAATSEANPVGALSYITATQDALAPSTDWDCNKEKTLFLNPPGDRSGKLVRAFWRRWDTEATRSSAACWVGFNLDQLRFVRKDLMDCLVIPRKRVAYVDPATGRERKGAQIGSFLLLRGDYHHISHYFPAAEFNHA